MDRGASINLDLARWLAALAVFCTHFVQLGTSQSVGFNITPLGRLGVVFFFVLSGYVISATVANKHTNWSAYMAARIGRLYSVLVPALALTWFADSLGRLLDPELYARFPGPISMRTLATLPFMLGFLYENSIFSLRWLSDSPMWSIAYEFWYYVAFGVVYFYRGRLRVFFLLATAVLAGWKVALLCPAWIAGVMIQRWGMPLPPRYRSPGILLCILLLVGLVSTPGYEMLAPLRGFGDRLPPGYHGFFLSDWLCAVPVTLLVWLLTTPGANAWPAGIVALVRKMANGSFALYLFHVPLILLLRALKIYDPTSVMQSAAAALALLSTCHLLSLVTEANKRPWVQLANRCLQSIASLANQRSRHV